jgi:hypothetical protein
MDKKYVIVPQEDLDKLEEARLILWELIDKTNAYTKSKFSSVSQPMWYLAHRKYEEYEKDKV